MPEDNIPPLEPIEEEPQSLEPDEPEAGEQELPEITHIPVKPKEPEKPKEEILEPLTLVEGDEEPGVSKVKALRTAAMGGKKIEFKRPLNTDGSGATRFKLFHSKIALSSLEHMEDMINEWLESDKIEVKDVGHVIGIMEGKRPEPNVLVMIWY